MDEPLSPTAPPSEMASGSNAASFDPDVALRDAWAALGAELERSHDAFQTADRLMLDPDATSESIQHRATENELAAQRFQATMESFQDQLARAPLDAERVGAQMRLLRCANEMARVADCMSHYFAVADRAEGQGPGLDENDRTPIVELREKLEELFYWADETIRLHSDDAEAEEIEYALLMIPLEAAAARHRLVKAAAEARRAHAAARAAGEPESPGARVRLDVISMLAQVAGHLAHVIAATMGKD